MGKCVYSAPLVSLSFVLFSASALAQTSTAQTYSIAVLGNLGGGSTYGTALNNKGQVTGFSSTTGGATYDPFLTGINGEGITDLGNIGGYTLGYGVNDIGQVVGYGQPAAYYNGQAFITGPNGSRITPIGTLTTGTYSRATGINNSGQVAGYIGNSSTNTDSAFITGPNGVGFTALGTLGGDSSTANAINGSGQVVGDAVTAGFTDDAFITGVNGTSMQDLAVGPDSATFAVNNSGQAAGTVATPGNGSDAFLSAPNGGPSVNLGSIGGANASAFGVSNTGQVVGWAQIASGTYDAFVFSNGSMVDLNSLVKLADGAYLTQATAINDRNQIVAQGSDGLSYLLSPPIRQQLAAVLAVATSAGAGNGILGKWEQAQDYYAAHDVRDACRMLNAVAVDSKALSGKTPSLSLSRELAADAEGLAGALNCSD
jgi:probable HAF family extracellular repeat protein